MPLPAKRDAMQGRNKKNVLKAMVRIVLLGYMGAGKTTVGHQLAASLGLPFYDLDWYIQMRFHRTVEQLFQERGEEGFREIERNMLHEVAEFENVVISCGGGTPCFFDNMEYLNSNAETVYLKAEPEVLALHLKMGKVVRPLIKGKTDDELLCFIRESLEKREKYYLQAKHVFDVSLLDNYDKIETSVALLRKELGL